jgi:hypothetical protein
MTWVEDLDSPPEKQVFRSIRSIFLAVVTLPMRRRDVDVLDIVENQPR